MNRFFVIGLLVIILTFSYSFAYADRGNVGCGLGTTIMAGKMDSTLMQVFAVTTNGTSGNQTFGITSGTLECSQPSSFVNNERLIEFVASNMDSLAVDMAAGSGESLDTLAELMGVSDSSRDGFYAKLQQNFNNIFTSSAVQSGEVIDNIIKVTT
jgi:hypothetical protein